MSLNHRHAYNLEIRAWLLKVFDHASRIARGKLIERVCPGCGSRDYAFFANNGFLDYARCKACSLVFQNPAPEATSVDRGFEGEDDLLREYFGIAAKYKADIPSRPDPTTHGKLRDIYACKPGGKLLDVGCSVGDFLHLAKHFYDVEGVEVNPVTAQIAQHHFKVHRAFLSELCLPPLYDVVTLHQILYGVPDPTGLLRDIHAVLKDDGILYINTPNADSYASKLYGGRSCHLYGYTTLNVFSPDALRRLAEQTGFRVIDLRSEWLDIYATDLQEFYDSPDRFIHKRNCHLPDYEAKIAAEDRLHESLGLDLGTGGNYLVAIFGKA